MKRLILLACIFLTCGFVYGQKPMTYSEVINKDSMSAAELYKIAMGWFASYYNNSNNIIKYADKENNEITGKANLVCKITSLTWSWCSGHVSYDINIKTKDNRLKFIITNYTYICDVPGINQNLASIGVIYDKVPEDIGSIFGKPGSTKYNSLYNKIYEYAIPICEDETKNIILNFKEYLNSSHKEDDNW